MQVTKKVTKRVKDTRKRILNAGKCSHFDTDGGKGGQFHHRLKLPIDQILTGVFSSFVFLVSSPPPTHEVILSVSNAITDPGHEV